ncbi:sensor histidine kinase [Halobacterium litoreum]|uniref:histidine kinase n=1 Tax=Halobacterium litoreum TaxID=2039234 RepID=A0ABD5NFM1_9EURY|nr:histidine kinase N-terminal 7TM domain-containing protein [Halobacterium litoreum]UHH13445.1 ATP-binding protein [Halobacterium litoreum]
MLGLIGGAVVLATFTAGAGTLALVWYLDRYRGRAGATWFMATLSAQSLWAFSYGVGLLVSERALRAYLEALSLVGLVWLGPLFLGFALEYTGRTDVVQSNAFRAVLAVPAVVSGLALTHPFHDLLWRNFRAAPVFDLSTVLYAIQPAGYLAAVVDVATVSVAVLLLVEAMLAYGPLYRREAIAVAASTVPPAAGLLVWLTKTGPWPALNLGVALLLPHVALDAYAFVGTHMFGTNPTTQRAAEQSALDDREDPLFVVDTDGRVVKLNDRAADLFGADPDALPTPFAAITGTELAALRDAGELDVSGPGGGVYAVSYTPLEDSRDDSVGGIVALYDITEERQREQRLTVLNRVLRHNLRNELTVATGHAQSIASKTDDDGIASQAEMVADAGDRLLSVAENARDFERLQERDVQRTAVDPASLLDRVRGDVREDHPDAEIDTEIGVEGSVRTDPDVLALALSNLVENAIAHADDPEPAVSIRVSTVDDATVFEVRDGNERIPDIETATLHEGDETQLQHGQGMGLWVVNWCVTALDGDVTFDYDDGNVVRVALPN